MHIYDLLYYQYYLSSTQMVDHYSNNSMKDVLLHTTFLLMLSKRTLILWILFTKPNSLYTEKVTQNQMGAVYSILSTSGVWCVHCSVHQVSIVYSLECVHVRCTFRRPKMPIKGSLPANSKKPGKNRWKRHQTGIKAVSGSYSSHSTTDCPASNKYLKLVLSSNEEKFNTFHV